jgi:hypothetical protein
MDEEIARQHQQEREAMERRRDDAPDLSIPIGYRLVDDAEEAILANPSTYQQTQINYELFQRQKDREEREESLQRARDVLEREQQLLKEAKQRDDEFLEALQRQQLEALRRENKALQENTSRRSPPHPVGAAQTAFHVAGDPYYEAKMASIPSSSSETANLASVITTLQKMLEHERAANERLVKQLEDRDRVAMEHMLAEAEREQREITMRVRMLEAIAAHRREQQLLAEEERAKEHIAAESIRGRLQLEPARFIPQHPLEDADEM